MFSNWFSKKKPDFYNYSDGDYTPSESLIDLTKYDEKEESCVDPFYVETVGDKVVVSQVKSLNDPMNCLAVQGLIVGVGDETDDCVRVDNYAVFQANFAQKVVTSYGEFYILHQNAILFIHDNDDAK